MSLRNILRVLSSSAMLAGFVLAPVARAQQIQAPCSSGQQPLCYGEYANCSLSPSTDLDVYQFFGTVGDRVRVSMTTSTVNLDPKMEMFLPSGLPFVPTGALSCTADQFNICRFSNEFTLPESGMYTMAISDIGVDNAGSYYLVLERVPPEGPLPKLEYGVAKTLNFGFPGEVEWLQFDVEQGTSIRINCTGTTVNLDPRIRIYRPDGVVIQAAIGCNADQFNICSFMVDIGNAPMTGVYKAMLYDEGLDNTGNLSVNLGCILGNCPPPNPTTTIGQTFCTSNPNTTTNTATIEAYGSRVIADNDVYLKVSNAPKNKFAIYFAGALPNLSPAPLPFSEGNICINSPIVRLPVQFTCSNGTIGRQLDLTDPRLVPILAPGQPTYFQAWFRDPTVGGQTYDTNTSDGLKITFL